MVWEGWKCMDPEQRRKREAIISRRARWGSFERMEGQGLVLTVEDFANFFNRD